MRIKTLFIALVGIMLISCQSPEQKLRKKINHAYGLLEKARIHPEVDMSVPLGFDLSFTEKEFEAHCDKWIETKGGRRQATLTYLYTYDFGGKYRSVRMSCLPYFSDPNTRTDELSSISFIFDEFRDNSSYNGGWRALKEAIDSTFDDSWATAEFYLDEYAFSPNYYKFWVKNNLAVQFHYHSRFVVLEFFNVPRYGTKFFKDDIEGYLDIKLKVEKESATTPKYEITNSTWDGSVWQVKKYLKSTLKDPDSYEGIEWSSVVKDGNNYRVRHKYRAKNSLGGYVVEEKVFTLNEQGSIINVAP